MGRRTGSWKSLVLMAFWLQASTRAGCEGLGQETCVEKEKLAELHGPDCVVLCFEIERRVLAQWTSPVEKHIADY